MDAGTVITHIIKITGPQILLNPSALCNCIDDLIPQEPARYQLIRMIYDKNLAKMFFALYQDKVGDRTDQQKEIKQYLIENKKMSEESCKGFMEWFNGNSHQPKETKSVVDCITSTKAKINNQTAINIISSANKKYKIGYCTEFGTYPYWADGRSEKIVWRVHDIVGNKALLITNKIIDVMPMVNDPGGCSWKNAFLSQWLNSVFYVTAFSNLEMAQIILNPDTKQTVAIPSVKELELYFSDNTDKKTKTYSEGKAKVLATPYAKVKFDTPSKNGFSPWWLRDFMDGYGKAKYVTAYGQIREPRYDGNAMKAQGVRAMIWINTET